MEVVRELLASKKFVTALLTVVGAVAIKLGAPETDVVELTTMLSPFLLYIGGQAVADAGKERAKIEKQPIQVVLPPETTPEQDEKIVRELSK